MKTAIKIYQQHGLKKLYTGYSAVYWRESISFSIYFSVYEKITRVLAQNPKSIDTGSALLAGGISGVVTFIVPYPFDFAATLMMSDSITKPRHSSVLGYWHE